MNKYGADFKKEAVKRVVENKTSAVQVARELGISRHTLYSWIKEYKTHHKDAFVGSGNLRPKDKEIRDYERRIKDLEEENAILKKAAAFFAKNQKL